MSKFARFLCILWMVAAGAAGSPQPCAAETPVTLRNSTEVHRLVVRLSDVFDGIAADADHDIAQAPPPGKQVSYDVNVLNRLAQKYKLAWKSQSLADHVVITTACSHITSDMVRDAVVEKIRDMNVTSRKNVIDVTFDNHGLDIAVPDEHAPDFTLNNFEYDNTAKHFRSDLVINSPNGVYVVLITGRVTVKRGVPVLSRRLEGGTLVGAADLDTLFVPEDHANAGIITEAEQLVGHELRRDTNGGEAIHTQDVILPRYVTRGSLVTLMVETPYMMLTAQGKALQDGAKGDAVRVINTQSNRMIEGTVDGPGTVRVDINQKIAAIQ